MCWKMGGYGISYMAHMQKPTATALKTHLLLQCQNVHSAGQSYSSVGRQYQPAAHTPQVARKFQWLADI